MLINRAEQSIPMNSIDIYSNAHVKMRHAKTHDHNGNVKNPKTNSGKYFVLNKLYLKSIELQSIKLKD